MASEDYVIKVILQAVDQVTAPLKNIQKSLGSLGGVVGTLGAYFGFKAMLHNIEEAEEATHRLELSVKLMGQNAGRTAEQLSKLSDEIQHTTRFSDEAAKEAAVKMLRFNKITGDSFDRAIKLSADLAESMQMDLPAAARMVGMALQDPTRGMMLLRRAGITLSADLQQTIRALVKTGDTAQAQQIIFKELEKRVGGFAAAARNTLSGALQALENQFTDLFEGDSSTFGGAVKAINNLTETLQKPEIKEGFNILIDGFVTAAGKAVTYTAAIAEGAKVTAEFFAKLVTGNKYGTDPLDILYSRLDDLKKEREVYNPFVPWGRTLKEIDADIENTKKQIIQLQVENSKGPIYNPTPKLEEVVVTASRTAGDSPLTDEELKKLQELRDAALDGVAKVTQEWADKEKKISEALRSGAVSQQQANESLAALARDIRQQVLPEELTFGEDLQPKIDAVVAALDRGAVSAEEAGNAIIFLNRQMASEAMPEYLKQTQEWEAALQRIEAALKNLPGYTREMAEAARTELSKKYLTTEGLITAKRMDAKEIEHQLYELVHKPSEFAVQAAHNIQDAFADAFMNIGHGMGSFFDGLKNSFKSLLANLAAKKLAEALGLTELLEGKAAKGGLGKVLQDIFDVFSPKKTASGKPGGSAGGGLEEIKVTATRMDPLPVEIVQVVSNVDLGVDSRNPSVDTTGVWTNTNPLPVFVVNWPDSIEKQCKCVQEAVQQATSAGDSATADAINESTDSLMTKVIRGIQSMLGGLREMFAKMLGGLGNMMNAVVAGIARIAGKAGGGGGVDWGQIAGTVVQVVGSYFASSAAHGGRIRSAIGRAGGGMMPTLVGEEGPELFFPGMSGTIFNNRQLAFAGAGRGPINYSPTYHISVSGVKDDKKIVEEMRYYIDRKDAETEARMYEQLRRNGYGRMKR